MELIKVVADTNFIRQILRAPHLFPLFLFLVQWNNRSE
jgi:hypothetical protein